MYCYHDIWPRLRAKRQLCTNNINGNAGRYYWACCHPAEDCKQPRTLWILDSTQRGGF